MPSANLGNLLFVLLVLLPGLATPISFDYTRFDHGVVTGNSSSGCPEGIRRICLQEDAMVVGPYSYIQLTNRVSGSGIALYSEPLQIWDDSTGKLRLADFTTSFSVNFTKTPSVGEKNCSATLADGLAFFLLSYPFSAPPNSKDGMLGLVTKADRLNASGDSSFVAVEVDTFTNTKWDPPFFHLGIDVNSIKSVTLSDISSIAGDSLDVIGDVEIIYNSATGNLTATMTRSGITYANLTHHVDLSRTLPQLVSFGLSATTGYCTEYFNVQSWRFNSTLDRILVAGDTSDRKKILLLAICVPLGVLVLVVAVFLVLFLARRRAGRKEVKVDKDIDDDDDGEESEDEGGGDVEALGHGGGPRKLRFKDLVAATDNFDKRRKLGSGGSGAVYRGFLKDLNRQVAIKRVVNRGPEQGRKEYIAEVKAISRLRHRHLVELVGWCHQKDEFLLAYELMPNLSLDHHLFKSGGRSLPWPVRYNIALGVASALQYLHEGGDKCVVHRDVKSSNIMLDEDFQAKLGDFGLARLADHGRSLKTTAPGGTLAYMSPEYFATGKASKESDVYAFGIVALEIATGKKAVEAKSGKKGEVRVLVNWVWDHFGRDAIMEAADKRLGTDLDRTQIEHLMVVGLWCAHPDADRRPSIGKAIAALNFQDVEIDVPKQMPKAIFAVPHELPSTSGSEMDPTTTTSFADISLPSIYFGGR